MKRLTNLFICLLAAPALFAQTNYAQKTAGFSHVISTVLKDFPFNYRNITGELIVAQAEIENYESTIVLPGAERCIITRYHSGLDTTASWQAVMYRSEEFGQAAKQYHHLYKQINNSAVKLVDGSALFLHGTFEPAREELDFTTSALRLQTGDDRYKDVKIEIELQYQMPEWVIYVNVVTKKRDDEVRPDWMLETK